MFFTKVNQAPPDPIFGLLGAFSADPRQQKVNLTVGIYKDDQLKSELFHSVKKGRELSAGRELIADYLPIDGLKEMVDLLGPIVFGEKEWRSSHERIYAAHTVGGTGALRIGADFLAQEVGKSIYVPNHTWANHRLVFAKSGHKVIDYPYYSSEKKGVDFDAMLGFLENLPEKSIVLLHACCHNPTGCDPKPHEWQEISLLMREKKLFPFFDFAYQGLGDGLDQDGAAVRMFVKDGHEMMVAYSCSKNFSLYCQRVGALFIINQDSSAKSNVGSHIKRTIRSIYSNPPAEGARIVVEVLKNEDLVRLWHKDLESVRDRIHSSREQFIKLLNEKSSTIDFRYLKEHKGMFSFIDMDKSEVKEMVEKYAIYMLDSGRISIPGLTSKNIDYVTNSLLAVCEGH